MRENVFQRELRPTRTVDIGGPLGEGATFDPPEILAVHERPVGEYGDAAVAGHREQAVLRFRFRHRIVHVNEIGSLRPHEGLESCVKGAARDGHADVAGVTSLLPFAKVRPLRFEIGQALDLYEVQRPPSEQTLGLSHLGGARLTARRVDLDRHEQRVPKPRLLQYATECGVDLLRPGGGIHDAAAVSEQRVEHGGDDGRSVGGDLQDRLGRAEPDDGEALPG